MFAGKFITFTMITEQQTRRISNFIMAPNGRAFRTEPSQIGRTFYSIMNLVCFTKFHPKHSIFKSMIIDSERQKNQWFEDPN